MGVFVVKGGGGVGHRGLLGEDERNEGEPSAPPQTGEGDPRPRTQELREGKCTRN